MSHTTHAKFYHNLVLEHIFGFSGYKLERPYERSLGVEFCILSDLHVSHFSSELYLSPSALTSLGDSVSMCLIYETDELRQHCLLHNFPLLIQSQISVRNFKVENIDCFLHKIGQIFHNSNELVVDKVSLP